MQIRSAHLLFNHIHIVNPEGYHPTEVCCEEREGAWIKETVHLYMNPDRKEIGPNSSIRLVTVSSDTP